MLYYYLILSALLLTNFEARATKDVIVIGAGPSGIAAATRLLENNITNILVLEAENRIGGRVYSVKIDKAYVDLGGEWCHGEKNNVVYEMVKPYNLLIHNSNFDLPSSTFSNGSSVVRNQVVQDFDDLLMQYVTYVGLEIDENEVISIGEHFLRNYNKTLLQKYKNDPESLKLLNDLLPAAEDLINSLEGTFSWFEPSIVTEFEECEGSQSLEWNGLGYKIVLDIMLKKYPDPAKQLPIDDKILLNKVVSKIVWNNDADEVVLTCEDGAEYKANHVIFTPSLGVLKAKHKQLFHPELPLKKQESIEKLGFSAVMKIVLRFPTRWWINSLEESLIWKQQDIEEMTKQGKQWITNIHNAYSHNNTNVLTLWITGKVIPEIEKLSNESLLEGSMFVINKFFGKKFQVVNADMVLRTTWYTNPHFLGTYSSFSVEACKLGYNAHDELAVPLLNSKNHPFLLFAGEATNKKHSSTVHGAIESGYREADRIIKQHESNINLV